MPSAAHPELRIPSQPPTQHASAATTSCISKRTSTVEIDVPTRAANFIAAQTMASFSRHNIMRRKACEHCRNRRANTSCKLIAAQTTASFSCHNIVRRKACELCQN